MNRKCAPSPKDGRLLVFVDQSFFFFLTRFSRGLFFFFFFFLDKRILA